LLPIFFAGILSHFIFNIIQYVGFFRKEITIDSGFITRKRSGEPLLSQKVFLIIFLP